MSNVIIIFYSGVNNNWLLLGPLECQSYKQTRENSYRIRSENETLNKKVLSKRQKLEKDALGMMLSGKLLQS